MAKPRKPSQEKVGLDSINQSNTKAIVLGAAAVVVVLGLIAAGIFFANRSDDSASPSGTQTLEFRPVTITGASLPDQYSDANQSQLNEAVGAQAPDISGSTFDGAPTSITKDGRGKVVLFVAHWCPHCQKEFPLITDWLPNHKSDYPNVDFYAVATGSSPVRANYPPSKWFDRTNWTNKVIVDDNATTAAKAYGLGSYPYMVFLDGQNKVVTRTSGELPISDFATLVQRTQRAATGAPVTTGSTAPTTEAPQSKVGQ